jgi:hypothetical protein
MVVEITVAGTGQNRNPYRVWMGETEVEITLRSCVYVKSIIKNRS